MRRCALALVGLPRAFHQAPSGVGRGGVGPGVGPPFCALTRRKSISQKGVIVLGRGEKVGGSSLVWYVSGYVRCTVSAMDVLSVTEAASITGFTPQHLRRLLRSGKVVGRMAGGVWLIEKSSLQEYLSHERIAGRSPKAQTDKV